MLMRRPLCTQVSRSMWPLLKRDGLGVQYFVLLLLWNRMIGYSPLHASPSVLRYGATVSRERIPVLEH